ncbi:MAG: N-formylglutamate amidohydrolase [Rhizobiales bacterium]|nr:N-formylglutamate amidohydrolase [Hyphomicrobiales bacterium]
MASGEGARSSEDVVTVTNRAGRGRFVVICDHASNRIPERYRRLGLDLADLERHIAWDPGALPVSEGLAEALDAPLVAAGLSRLLIDCNRPLDAPDLIAEVSETTVVPGNRNLDARMRAERIALAHAPFHDAVDALVRERLAAGRETCLVSVHSFTPVYKGVPRPWQIGILHDEDERLSRPMIAALGRMPGVVVGDNQPYSPADRVYYTLERHGRSRNLPCVMIEIRNDEIAGAAGQERWVDRLSAVMARLASDGGLAAGTAAGDARKIHTS